MSWTRVVTAEMMGNICFKGIVDSICWGVEYGRQDDSKFGGLSN